MSTFTNAINRDVQVIAELLPDDGQIPNNPKLPLLIYPDVLSFGQTDPAATCEEIFAANQWGNSWRNGIYTFHHYHSTAHEVLAVACGEATVLLGGESGIKLTVSTGDVIVLPAGVGHKNLGQSNNLLVIGAYPPDQSWDLCYGHVDERPRVLENVAAVLLPPSDPVFGAHGPLMKEWKV